jgi:hypothetical protein
MISATRVGKEDNFRLSVAVKILAGGIRNLGKISEQLWARAIESPAHGGTDPHFRIFRQPHVPARYGLCNPKDNRMPRIPFLAHLCTQNQPVFQFVLGLQPIVQLTPWLFATFKIDFIRPPPDFLFTRRVPC